jgi:hypothetical protein
MLSDEAIVGASAATVMIRVWSEGTSAQRELRYKTE